MQIKKLKRSYFKELLLKVLKQDIEPFRELKLNKENWIKEFGKNQIVKTPIGEVKIGNNQYEKLIEKNRINDFGIIKLTLQYPTLALENSDNTLSFIKAFRKKNENIIFTSIIIHKFNQNISISIHKVRINNIINRIEKNNGIIKSFADDIYKTASTLQDKPYTVGHDKSLIPSSLSKTLNETIISENILNLEKSSNKNLEFKKESGEDKKVKAFVDDMYMTAPTSQDKPYTVGHDKLLIPSSLSKNPNETIISQNILKLQEVLNKDLEISILKVSEVLEDNERFRFDPEYFKKEYLHKINQLKFFGYSIINDMAFVTDGIHESIDFDTNSNINLISAKSPKENIFDLSNNDCISNKQHIKNPRTKLINNDVIISTVGTIGNCAVVDNTILPANSDRHVGIVRLNNEFKPHVLSTFLLSKYGRFQTFRESTGNVQLNLFIYKIKTLKIPNFSDTFQIQIEELVKLAHQKLENSKIFYKQSEELLLKELDLLDFKPSKQNIAIKSFSESFGDSGRLDSEYYQPKYEDIIEKIKSYDGGYDIINIACNLKNTNYKPEDKKFYQYVELSNIGTTGDITGFTYEMGQDLPSRARRLIKENDVIISSIEGSLEKIAIVRKEFDNSLCSTGFYVINSKKINSETLLVLFKNKIIQQILKQNCSGTILTGMNKDEFLNIIIPIIDNKIQTQIESKIKKSFKLKEESKKLLEVAKKAVEIAIEENENQAMRFINND